MSVELERGIKSDNLVYSVLLLIKQATRSWGRRCRSRHLRLVRKWSTVKSQVLTRVTNSEIRFLGVFEYKSTQSYNELLEHQLCSGFQKVLFEQGLCSMKLFNSSPLLLTYKRTFSALFQNFILSWLQCVAKIGLILTWKQCNLLHLCINESEIKWKCSTSVNWFQVSIRVQAESTHVNDITYYTITNRHN